MKIAFISRWFFDEHQRSGGAGGGEQQRVAAYRELGHEVIVLSQSPDAGVLERRNLNGIPVILTPRWKRLPALALLDKLAKPFSRHRKLFSDAWQLRQFLKRYGPFDIIEAQCEEPDGLVVALLSCFQKLPPWAVQIFALRYHFRDSKPVFEQRRALGFVFRRAGLVKANSELVAKHLRDDYGCPREKIAVVPHNLTRQFLETPTSATAKPTTPRVLCLGALNEKKGIRFFVEAAALLKEKMPGARFVSVGGSTAENAYAGELRDLSHQLKLDDRLQWLGELRGEKLRAEIAAASVVVIPSLFDEWNRAAVEVVALGRPVVIADGCGAADWVETNQAGKVVPAGDARSIAKAVEEILSTSTPPAAAGIRAARAEFSPQVIAKLNLQVFGRFMNNPPHA